MQFTTELERVVAGGTGHMIGELNDGVRSLEFRPLETAQAGEEIAAKPDAWQSAGEWTRDAGVEPITRCQCSQIARQSRLVKAVISHSHFIDPARTGGPCLTSAKHLRASMNVGSPLGLVFGK